MARVRTVEVSVPFRGQLQAPHGDDYGKQARHASTYHCQPIELWRRLRRADLRALAEQVPPAGDPAVSGPIVQ